MDQETDTPLVAAARIDANSFYDIEFLCRLFGGDDSPLHPSTIYRGIRDGRVPRPIKTAPNVNRWLGRELIAAREQMIAAERDPLPAPAQRARKTA
jgi:hypothetical protein